MKRILMTTAIAALAASPVLAASETDDENTAKASESASMSQDNAGTNVSGDVVADAQGMQIRASDLIGKAVYIRGEESAEAEITDEASEPADDWERIGEVGDVIISKDGKIDSVTLDAGGFLGINEKHVSASMDEMKFVTDNSETSDENDGDSYFIVFTGDKAALEDREKLDQTAVRDTGSSFFNEDSSQDMASTDMDEQADEDAADAGNTDMSAEQDSEQMAESDTADAENTDMAEQDSEEMSDNEMAESDSSAMTAEQDSEQRAETEAADSEETDLTAQQQSENDDQQMSENTDDMDNAAEETAQLSNDERGQLTAEELEGVSVYGSEDDRLGEISNLVLSDDGKIDQVIVDVGGFLGLGEKPVALPFNEIELRRSNDSLTGGLRATTGYNSEELEGMDSWEG